MPPQYILAHDVGTGGDKAVLTDLTGRIIQSAFRDYPLRHPRPGWVEQDPEELWQAVAVTTREVIDKADIDPRQVLGVGVSAQMFNLLAVDAHGRPVTSMLSWLDTRSAPQADRLLAGDLPTLLFEKTGNLPTAKDVIPKILWLKEERPDLWARTAKLLDCKEYILFRLTGRIAIDWHGASVFFLFDPIRKEWSQEVLDALGIPRDLLPDPLPCTQIMGEITEQAARETGLGPGTPVVICAGDVAVAQSGAGASRAGKAHLCIGTATWVGVSSRDFRNDPDKPFWALSHIDRDKWIIAGEMETGGGALMWFRDAFCQGEARRAGREAISGYELLGRMAASVEPGADRLLFAPWLTGERAPVLDHYARGAFVGLSFGHTKSHLARAVMEGVAFHLRWIMESLERLGLANRTVNAIGGGSLSPLWTQIIADVTGRVLDVVENPQESGAIGAALAVAAGLGVYPNMEAADALIRIARRVEPRPDLKDRYDDLYREYRALYEALAPIFRRMHKVR